MPFLMRHTIAIIFIHLIYMVLNYISTVNFGKLVYPFMMWNDALTAYICIAVGFFTTFSMFVLKYLIIFKLKVSGSMIIIKDEAKCCCK